MAGGGSVLQAPGRGGLGGSARCGGLVRPPAPISSSRAPERLLAGAVVAGARRREAQGRAAFRGGPPVPRHGHGNGG